MNSLNKSEKERERSRQRRAQDPEFWRVYNREHKRKWRAANPKPRVRRFLTEEERKSKQLANARKWTAANPERAKEIQRRWRENNPERWIEIVRKASKAWVKRHPEAVRAAEAHRRSVKRKPLQWAERDKMRVVYAKAKEWNMEVDHIVPLRGKLVSGLHVWSNLQLLARPENRRKKNIHWPDMP